MTRMRKVLLVLMLLILTIVYSGFMYLQMCTASIYEGYQKGISKIQYLSATNLTVFIILLTILIPGEIGKGMASFANKFGIISLCICLLFAFLFFYEIRNPTYASTWRLKNERTLSKTLKISLENPQFSMRSLGVVFYDALFSIGLILLSKRKSKI